MKEHPILFRPEMVRALLGGYKTQTRRLPERAKNYTVGDRLWVRETWGHNGCLHCPIHYRATEPDWVEKSGNPNSRWRPSIFMPREYSRITLEITEIRFEDLSSITREDAIAEGITEYLHQFANEPCTEVEEDAWRNKTSVENYIDLWDSINLKPTPIKRNGAVASYESYPSNNTAFDSAFPGVRDRVYKGTYKNLPIDITANPEVAVITFRRVE